MQKDFNKFISQLKETNSTLESLTDFEKVDRNTHKISLKLHQLNHLIGREDLMDAIKELFEENKTSFEVLGILVAVRDNKAVLDASNNTIINIYDYFTSPEKIFQYIEQTGLKDVFSSKKITNLVDYVFGIEVGLDTNARKNRGGTIMENQVAKIFADNGLIYRTQVNSSEFQCLGGLGKDLKRFDFVIEKDSITYLIETNFYNGGGSKLNETARAYTDIAPKINSHINYEFVWITDGNGWLSARNKLEEAYNNIPRVYNLTTLSDFINELI